MSGRQIAFAERPVSALLPGMAEASLAKIASYCDRLLGTAQIRDYDGAANGLQVQNRGRVSRIGAVVDASLATVKLAAGAGVDLLIAHHGLFWGASHPWTGQRYELMRMLLEHNMAVYSSHLPLDMHRQLGNNAQMAKALGFRSCQPFLISKGQAVGLKTCCEIRRDELIRRVASVTGSVPKLLPGGPEKCRRIGIATGGAGGEIAAAAAEGVDTFITGEGPHWTYALAEDSGVNVLYGGHYATETLGVKALAGHLGRKFRVPWVFLDHPTGL